MLKKKQKNFIQIISWNPAETTAAYILLQVALLNIVPAMFNLIPIPPLDGSHLFKYLLPQKLQRSMEDIDRYENKKKFADRYTEYDKRLMEAHIKKEKNSLKKESQRLEDKRSMMREHLYRLEAFIEKHDDVHAHT